MRHIRKMAVALAAGAAFGIAAPASAAVFACSDGGIDLTVDQCIAAGNDNAANVAAAILAATGEDVDLVLYGKSDDASSVLFNYSVDPDGAFTVDWATVDGTVIDYVTVKGGNQFKVYEFNASSGTVSSAGLVVGAGKTPEISHLSHWNPSGAVPEPATWGMMLLGFGLMGAALRRRRPRVTVGYSFA